MLLFTLSRSELDKCCPETYNERMEVLPSAPYWRAGKVLPVFVPAPLQHRAWRINPNTLSGFALAPTHGGAGRATRPQKQRPLSGYAATPPKHDTRADAAGRTRGGAFPR